MYKLAASNVTLGQLYLFVGRLQTLAIDVEFLTANPSLFTVAVKKII